MAFASNTETHVKSGLWAGICSVFAVIGRAIMTCASGDARLREVEVLNAKTDEELAKLGLRREDIPTYVFRDLMHI